MSLGRSFSASLILFYGLGLKRRPFVNKHAGPLGLLNLTERWKNHSAWDESRLWVSRKLTPWLNRIHAYLGYVFDFGCIQEVRTTCSSPLWKECSRILLHVLPPFLGFYIHGPMAFSSERFPPLLDPNWNYPANAFSIGRMQNISQFSKEDGQSHGEA